jgi:hypothetical protein
MLMLSTNFDVTQYTECSSKKWGLGHRQIFSAEKSYNFHLGAETQDEIDNAVQKNRAKAIKGETIDTSFSLNSLLEVQNIYLKFLKMAVASLS